MAARQPGSIDEWMNNTLNPDMFVSTSENFTARDFRFPASMQQELEAVPGVAEVQPVRMIRVQYRGPAAADHRDRHGEGRSAASARTWSRAIKRR